MEKNTNRRIKPNSIKRLLSMLIKAYPVLVPIVAVCIVIGAITATLPAIFQQKIYSIIGEWMESGDWAGASKLIIPLVSTLASFYVVSLLAGFTQSQMMAVITQGFLNKVRLPIRDFDTNKPGDIMSHDTNDIDTLRQMVSQALPTVLRCCILLTSVMCIMLYYSLWMTLVVLLGVFAMLKISKKVGSGSAKYFIRQQKSMGKTEGFIQEMMTGQKVVKVFNHEPQSRKDFQQVNDELFEDAFRAHAYANVLGPIINNIGNTLYVTIAVVGGVLLLTHTPNIGISSLVKGSITVLSIDIVIPFLNMAKQFTGNVNQVAQQINSIAMAIAGAERIFELIDEKPETDEGYVTLVNAEIDADGNVNGPGNTRTMTGRFPTRRSRGIS